MVFILETSIIFRVPEEHMDFLKVYFHCQDRELEIRARCPGTLQLDAWEQPAALSGDAWKIRHRMGGSPEVLRGIG